MAEATENATAPTAVTVGTSLVKLLSGAASYRRSLVIQNLGAGDLYLGFFPTGTDATGAAALTTSSGIKLIAGATWTDNAPGTFSGDIWARASAAGTDVRLAAF